MCSDAVISHTDVATHSSVVQLQALAMHLHPVQLSYLSTFHVKIYS